MMACGQRSTWFSGTYYLLHKSVTVIHWKMIIMVISIWLEISLLQTGQIAKDTLDFICHNNIHAACALEASVSMYCMKPNFRPDSFLEAFLCCDSWQDDYEMINDGCLFIWKKKFCTPSLRSRRPMIKILHQVKIYNVS